MKTSFYLSPALLRAAKVQAATEGVSLRAWLTRTITEALATAERRSRREER